MGLFRGALKEAFDSPGSSPASMMSAQKPSSMQRSFGREKGRLAAKTELSGKSGGNLAFEYSV
jgi:hypothetical protein